MVDFEKLLEKTCVHLGLAALFTLIYGTGVLVISPLLTTLLGGFNGVMIGHALFTSVLGFLYVKLLRGKSFKEKITGSIIGTTIVSIFSSYQKYKLNH